MHGDGTYMVFIHTYVFCIHFLCAILVLNLLQFVQDLNDVVSAEESLIKAIQLEPDNPMAHFSLG